MAAESGDQPLVTEGGLQEDISSNRDPFEILNDLMLVVEALCPVWPERETFEGQHQFRI